MGWEACHWSTFLSPSAPALSAAIHSCHIICCTPLLPCHPLSQHCLPSLSRPLLSALVTFFAVHRSCHAIRSHIIVHRPCFPPPSALVASSAVCRSCHVAVIEGTKHWSRAAVCPTSAPMPATEGGMGPRLGSWTRINECSNLRSPCHVAASVNAAGKLLKWHGRAGQICHAGQFQHGHAPLSNDGCWLPPEAMACVFFFFRGCPIE